MSDIINIFRSCYPPTARLTVNQQLDNTKKKIQDGKSKSISFGRYRNGEKLIEFLSMSSNKRKSECTQVRIKESSSNDIHQ